MKIAFFVNAFPMVSEVFIASSAAALIDRGHEVDLYGISNLAPSKVIPNIVEQAGLVERSRDVTWPTDPAAGVFCLPKAVITSLFRHGPFRTPLFKPHIYRRSWIDTSAFQQARILPRDGDYDILHCQFAPLAEFVLKHRAAGLLNGKVVVNFRGYDISEIIHDCGPSVYDKLWTNADGFIANCDYFRRRAIELGCPRQRIEMIGSGIRVEDFPFRTPRTKAADSLRFISIGRLIERKGTHHSLTALAALKAAGHSVRFEIVGDGADRAKLEQLARTLGLSDEVTFHGALAHEAIAEILERSDILLAPSLTSAKGGADAPVNSIKEAMATGVMIVATKHGGIPELVVDNVNGTLAREDDAADLTDAIQRLLDMRPNWPDIAAHARDEVIRLYGIDTVTAQLEHFYAALTAEQSAPIPANPPLRSSYE
ncbi:MAG: glycosyltransferase [Pseudomonadota bacterium]